MFTIKKNDAAAEEEAQRQNRRAFYGHFHQSIQEQMAHEQEMLAKLRLDNVRVIVCVYVSPSTYTYGSSMCINVNIITRP